MLLAFDIAHSRDPDLCARCITELGNLLIACFVDHPLLGVLWSMLQIPARAGAMDPGGVACIMSMNVAQPCKKALEELHVKVCTPSPGDESNAPLLRFWSFEVFVRALLWNVCMRRLIGVETIKALGVVSACFFADLFAFQACFLGEFFTQEQRGHLGHVFREQTYQISYCFLGGAFKPPSKRGLATASSCGTEPASGRALA